MRSLALCTLLAAIAVGCNDAPDTPNRPAPGAAGAAGPVDEGTAEGGVASVFSLAWSEYPSWSVFGVAHEKGLLNKDEGEMGTLEEKYGVDIVLKQLDYDPCLTAYGSGSVDAVCMTNMDALAPATGLTSVAILPTSTSDGADACIAVGIEDLDGLKGVTTYGLEKSVSQYAFERCLIKEGRDPADYPFRNMDPGTAAVTMQNGDDSVKSIMVWNPFVLQTLRDRDGATRLFDSTQIPEEIIDMVVVSKSALERDGGEAFAKCVCEAFYAVNGMLQEGAEGRDDTLVMLGEKFSSLGLEDMKQVVTETKMYATADDGIGLFAKDSFRGETMPTVAKFCVDQAIIDEAPSIGFGDAEAQLNFDPQYMEAVKK